MKLKSRMANAAFLIILLLGTGCAASIPNPAVEGFNPSNLTCAEAEDIWGKTLKDAVSSYGLIDFQKAAEAASGLSTYLAFVAEVGPYTHPGKFPSREIKFAHFINSYNALAMYAVIASKFPEDLYSIWDRSRFFNGNQYRVAGKWITLSDYEKEIVQSMQDPRVHFALNHMTVESPRLPASPFEANRLDEQLDKVAREFINNPYHVAVRSGDKSVRLSEIFEMHEKEFSNQGNSSSLLTYINRYRRREIPESFRVTFRPYNWFVKRKEILPPRMREAPEISKR